MFHGSPALLSAQEEARPGQEPADLREMKACSEVDQRGALDMLGMQRKLVPCDRRLSLITERG